MEREEWNGITRFVVIALAVITVLTACIAGFLFATLQRERERIVVQEAPWPVPTRMQVNVIVQDMIDRGEADQVYAWYERFTGDKERAVQFVTAALFARYPLHLALGTGAWEGLGSARLKDGPNADGSFDWGDMRLNDRTYRGVPVSLMIDPHWNIPTGIMHLAGLKGSLQSYEATLVAYNAGSVKGTGDERSPIYIGAVLAYERQYDLLFARRFQGEFETVVTR